jgi:aminopeptidase N
MACFSLQTFYTATVYSKGAEVIGMLHTLCGPEGYRRGTDLYFSRHDGEAVSCEDFLNCMIETNPAVDLSTFPRWYSQAGTPVVTVDVAHDAAASTMTLTVTQAIPTTPKQPETLPSLIPMAVGLVGPDGDPVMVDDSLSTPVATKVLSLVEAKHTFVFNNVPLNTVPSLFRGFSAPIKLVMKGGVDAEQLAFLMANDCDSFNCWESGQTLALDTILGLINSDADIASFPALSQSVINAFGKALANDAVEDALRAELFMLPLETFITDQVEVADPVRIRAARNHVRKQLAAGLKDKFEAVFAKCRDNGGEYELTPAAQGKRSLKNVALGYLATLGEKETFAICLEQVRNGSSMTDVLAAMMILANYDVEEREVALAEFIQKWQHEQLVVHKWFRIQAMSQLPGVLENTNSLLKHKLFDITVPNDVYALVGAFCAGSLHVVGGEAYTLIGDIVLRVDKLNPQVAARVARVFNRWRKFDATRQEAMKAQCQRILAEDGLSKDVYEIVSSCVA